MQGTLQALDHRLRREGYLPGSPSGEVAAQDAGICAASACRACRALGLELRSYVEPQARGYRPLAVCGSCGHAEEF